MASSRPGGQYYNFYYGSNKNACSGTGSSSSNYSGDGSGSVKGDDGRYNRIPVAGLSSPRARLTGGGAGNYRLSAGTRTTSWSSSANYSDYRNTTTAGSRVATADVAATAYCSSPASVTSPELGSKPGSTNSSVFLTRSDSVSSSGSARSTGTVCDETAASPRERQLRSTEPPYRAVTPPDPAAAAASPPPSDWLDGRGAAATTSPPNRGEVVAASRSWIHPTETIIAQQDNSNPATSPPLQRKNSEKYDVTDEPHEPPRPGARRGPTSPLRRGRPASGTPASAAGGGAEAEEDTQSVSTVSGSGIDFFRKFVQRKGGGGGCKECEDQFRREVLIDRLVADSKAVLAAVGSSSSSARSSCAAPSSGL
jgi:hypothetical protein